MKAEAESSSYVFDQFYKSSAELLWVVSTVVQDFDMTVVVKPPIEPTTQALLC